MRVVRLYRAGWFFLVFVVAVSFGDAVYSKNTRANRLYEQGKFEEALKLYDEALLEAPSEARLKMNRASALYKLGQFDRAVESYSEALSEKDKKVLADLHYNLGNAYFRQGQQAAMQGGGEALQKLEEAIGHYIKALDLRPSDRDAKWNLQIAEAVLDELKKQQQQQPQSNQQNKNDPSSSKSDQQQGGANQEGESKDQGDQSRDQDQGQDSQQDKNGKQQPMQQPHDNDMKKELAAQLLAQFADDADSLNKPLRRLLDTQTKKLEKDW